MEILFSKVSTCIIKFRSSDEFERAILHSNFNLQVIKKLTQLYKTQSQRVLNVIACNTLLAQRKRAWQDRRKKVAKKMQSLIINNDDDEIDGIGMLQEEEKDGIQQDDDEENNNATEILASSPVPIKAVANDSNVGTGEDDDEQEEEEEYTKNNEDDNEDHEQYDAGNEEEEDDDDDNSYFDSPEALNEEQEWVTKRGLLNH